MSDDLFWKQLMRILQAAESRFSPPEEEIERLIEEAPSVPLTEEETELLVSRVLRGETPPRFHPQKKYDDTVKSEKTRQIEEQVPVLNRNRGETDEKTERRLEELRGKLLNEKDDGEAHE